MLPFLPPFTYLALQSLSSCLILTSSLTEHLLSEAVRPDITLLNRNHF